MLPGVAGLAGWPPVEAVKDGEAAHGLGADAEFVSDVCAAALPCVELFSQPVRVDGLAAARVGQRDAEVVGVLGEEFAVDAGFGLNGSQILAGLE
ncbi:hypothetical protein [Micromonospora sp. NPDC050200]|uniref:hypothetical protein n=1 Tax=Micromonospora sp. NPDC050200 TaxID=3155664 RepID=UPI0033FE633E